MVQQLNTACLVIIVAVEVLGSIFCFGRLVSRFMAARRSWRGLMMWSDLCMLTAWVLSVGETVAMYQVTVYAHYGYHWWDMMHMKYPYVKVQQYAFANGLFYNPILGLVKASMILLYLRLGGTKDGVRIGCYALLVLNLALTVGAELADIFQCLPVQYLWDSVKMDLAAQKAAGANEPGMRPFGPWPTGFKNGVYVAGGQCFNLELYLMITGGLSILTDLLVLMIPVYMVYDLKLTKKKKIIVILILCMGLGVTAVGITRLTIIYYTYHPKDMDAGYSIRSTISQIETGLALVTGCIPDLFPMIRRCFPNFLRPNSHSLQPNPYPYKSNTTSHSSYSKRVRDLVNPSRSRNNSTRDAEDLSNVTYGLDTFNWSQDPYATAQVEVSGGGNAVTFSKSQEDVIEENVENTKGIVKTTQFTVEEQDITIAEEKRWSNV